MYSMARLLIFGILVICLFSNVVNSEEEGAESAVERKWNAIEELGTDSDMETLDSASILGDVLDRKKKKRKPKKSKKKPNGKAKKPRKKKPTKAKGKKPKSKAKGKGKKRPSKAKGKKKPSKAKGKKKPSKGKRKPSKGKGKKKPSKGKRKPSKGKGKKKPSKGNGKKPTIPSKGKKPRPTPKPASCKKPSSLICGSSPDNSMCKYTKPAAGCKLLSSSQLKKQVLDAHNEIRGKVRRGEYSSQFLPAATGPGKNKGMPDLLWDDGLACLAEAWTSQCIFGHDGSRKTTKFSGAGQNAYKTSDPRAGVSGTAATKLWFDGELPDWEKYQGDVKKFTQSAKTYVPPAKQPKKVFWQAVGHLTQVIWAKSTHIGCAQASNSGGTYVVCNYGPQGNFVDNPIYPS